MRQAGIEDVVTAVCTVFDIPTQAIRGQNRTRKYVRPRQVAYYLCRELTERSYPTIGRWFRRDHTTVIYGQEVIAKISQANMDIKEKMDAARSLAISLAAKRAAAVGADKNNPSTNLTQENTSPTLLP